MDALTEILRAMCLSGGVFLDAAFTAPWCIVSRVEPEDCLPFMPVPGQLIAYHYVVEGDLTLEVDGEPTRTAGAGQLLVLPRNEPHLLASETGLQPANINSLIEPADADGIARIRFGGGGQSTRILCGYLGTNDHDDPLLHSLPSVMLLDLGAKSTGDWIRGSIDHAMRELTGSGAGAASSLTRLAELLFAEAVREYVAGLSEDQAGWLGGLRDPLVGKAFALIHGRLDEPWSLESLSREVGASRSVLTDRFARTVGKGPMQYLRRRRLARAAEQLTNSSRPVSVIAIAAGYETESAFSRAFKREYGCAPTPFRETTRRA